MGSADRSSEKWDSSVQSAEGRGLLGCRKNCLCISIFLMATEGKEAAVRPQLPEL